jgi:processive 1,2-diacylglycerol beta-glucosyltransferase
MFNRVDIHHATAGGGHKSAALALSAAFEQAGAARDVRVFDALDYTEGWYTHMYREQYLKWAAKKPHLVGLTYDKLNTPWKQEKRRLFLDRAASCKYIDLLENSDADPAICTHFTPSELISWLRKKRRVSTPQAVVVTDVDVHAMWLCRNYEHYFVGREEAKVYLGEIGIRPQDVHVTGIPINPAFAVDKDKRLMRIKHGLSPDVTTVIVSAGGYGVGNIGGLLQAMLKVSLPLQVVAICGKNPQLKAEVDAIAHSVPAGHPVKIVPVGFTKQMDEFMSAADIVVGKPGGLTMSEALAKGLVFIVVNPIPGQEDRNTEHVLQNGAGMRCNHIEVLHWMLEQLIRDPHRLAIMQANARAIGFPYAAMNIVDKLVRAHAG